jgi:malonate-semialdehyde dehydrogenase (acetylating)/methylmalonate-semialdehyde dehydrogenase
MTTATSTGTRITPPREHYGRLKNYVNGQWVDSRSTDVRDIVNPATGRGIAQVPYSTPAEVRAVRAKAASDRRTCRRFAGPALLHLEALGGAAVRGAGAGARQELGKTIADARRDAPGDREIDVPAYHR